MAESLADFIVFSVPPEQQTKLLAETIAHLGSMVIEKSESGERDTKH
jgi:prephenate dehydrogenase